MKKIRQFLVFLNTSVLLTCAQAGTSTGPVTNIFMHTPDVVMFKAGTASGSPNCSPFSEWAIKLSDPAGKGFLAILLSAQAQGKSVKVLGYTNTCRDWGDRELPSYIMILD